MNQNKNRQEVSTKNFSLIIFYWFYQIDSSSHLHSSMNNSLICIKKMIPVQVLQSILVIVDHTMTSEQMEVKIYDNSKTVQLVKTQAATLCLIKVVTVTHYITSLFIPRCCFPSVLFCFLCRFFFLYSVFSLARLTRVRMQNKMPVVLACHSLWDSISAGYQLCCQNEMTLVCHGVERSACAHKSRWRNRKRRR